MLWTRRNILRLCRTKTVLYQRLNHIRAASSCENERNNQNNGPKEDFKELLQRYKDKITFNSYLEHEKLELGYFKYYLKTIKKAKETKTKDYQERSLPPLPVALKYYVDKDRLLDSADSNVARKDDSIFQLPFANTQVDITHKENVENPQDDTQNSTDTKKTEFDRSNMHKWMSNYENFNDALLDAESDDENSESYTQAAHYGTPDPTAAVSRVPCGGCGALLHCSDTAIPGYLPSELFKGQSEKDLKTTECQRCHFLKEYNIALDVSVQPEEYERLLQSVKFAKALVLVIVDLLDYPCSIWPGLLDIIGTDKPLIIVGNKVDLLPGDSVGYLKRIKESLLTEIKKTKLGEGNIKHVSLVSAKTGYGVEDLISVMFKIWQYKGDVYLAGCTNVGKSSLFNALLQSDYCKVQATDIIKRATVSRWPGTTLHLLKFPINRPTGWKIYQRTRRLNSEKKLMKVEQEIRDAQLQGKDPAAAPTLMGHIGRSFSDAFIERSEVASKLRNLMVLDEKHALFAKSKWLYDTPGVLHSEQVLPLLSTEELLLTIPKKTIRPQTYYLHEGSTIFIGGLARIDHVECSTPCRFTIFCSESLPITVTKTENANEVYEKFLGTELFAVPVGDAERLKHWPGLEKTDELLEFTGEGPKTCSGDILLSSVGWVSVTAKGGAVCKVQAWTPGGRGIHKRYPSVLPFAVNLKGKRIQDTPAYMVGKVFSED